MRNVFLFLLFLFTNSIIYAQNTEKVKKRLEKDSLYFATPYQYHLPIYGSEAHKRGYRPELPYGVMVNVLDVHQVLYPAHYSVGFGSIIGNTDPSLYNIEEIAKFENLESQSFTYNVRVDVWPLPFLNLYGIAGKLERADVIVRLIEPFHLNIPTTVEGWYLGAGMLLAGKAGPFFFSLDTNTNYNHNPKVDKPIMVNITGFRAGPVFNFKNNPDMNVVLWAGAMHTIIGSSTSGRVFTESIAPNASEKLAEMNGDLEGWYEELSPLDKIKYAPIYTILHQGIEGLSNNINNTFIDYQMDKVSRRPWNLILGVQWRINKKWELRSEAQLMGDRTAGMLSLNYRWGFKRKQFRK